VYRIALALYLLFRDVTGSLDRTPAALIQAEAKR